MTPSLSQPQRRVRLQLPETASYLQLHEKQKFLCKKLAHDKDVQHQQKVNSKQSKQKSPHCCSEERAAQPVSNVCSKEEQCMRNRQSRQEGGGGGGKLSRLFASTVSQCTFPTSKRGGETGRGRQPCRKTHPIF